MSSNLRAGFTAPSTCTSFAATWYDDPPLGGATPSRVSSVSVARSTKWTLRRSYLNERADVEPTSIATFFQSSPDTL